MENEQRCGFVASPSFHGPTKSKRLGSDLTALPTRAGVKIGYDNMLISCIMQCGEREREGEDKKMNKSWE
jgi:hypothetical protein